MLVNAQLQHKNIKRSISGHVKKKKWDVGVLFEKRFNETAKTELPVSIMLKKIIILFWFSFCKCVIHAVQKWFDTFDAVLIDLLSHFDLIVLFCGIVAAYCVYRNLWRNMT